MLGRSANHFLSMFSRVAQNSFTPKRFTAPRPAGKTMCPVPIMGPHQRHFVCSYSAANLAFDWIGGGSQYSLTQSPLKFAASSDKPTAAIES